jgi:hypothetical protein
VHFHEIHSDTEIWTLDHGRDSEESLPDEYEDNNDPRLPAIHRYIEGTMRISQKLCLLPKCP